jgi:hypothetical protein
MSNPLTLPPCPHRNDDFSCLVSSQLALLRAFPRIPQCQACTSHPTLPQRINGITCAVALMTQKKAGLIPDEKLKQCIFTEQTLNFEQLTFLRGKWKALHSYNPKPWDREKAKEFYKEWLKDLPEFGCQSCASHWETITKDNPIKFGSRHNYFLSTWKCHNMVNQKLFKPLLPLDEATKLYETM